MPFVEHSFNSRWGWFIGTRTTEKAEPVFSLLIKNDDDDLTKLFTDNSLRIEWIVQCTKDGTKIDKPFLDESFHKLMMELTLCFYESPDISFLVGGFRAFLLYLSSTERERYDNQLVDFFTDIVAGDYDKRTEQSVTFDHIFRFQRTTRTCKVGSGS